MQRVAETWLFVEWSNPIFFTILKCTHTAISSNGPNTVTYSGHVTSEPNTKSVRIFGTATGPPLSAVPKWESLLRNSEPFLYVAQQKPGTRNKKRLQNIANGSQPLLYLFERSCVAWVQ